MLSKKYKILIKRLGLEKIVNHLRYIKYLRYLTTESPAYLYSTGYTNSFYKSNPVDIYNNPVPWMNYSFVKFFTERLDKSMTIFEFGSGNSTLYLSKYVKNITSVEYDLDWYNKICVLSNHIENIHILYKDLKPASDYFKSIARNMIYDIILIDGRKRVLCAKIALEYIAKNGIIILDNSERSRYSEIFALYRNYGFKELTISGMAPLGLNVYLTTIFYKSNNIFNI